ncbi:SRPBCC family protein [Rhodococcus jostii]|uniref:Polyketide cyclase / dehydrase and lipid transport n=1 Tax=Rhodococcus jostii TaxID=132919 RepID=A0A1H4VVV4_RHOJO|nr:SRPBCC family protein [Rhodococcus jostii]SEC85206.1 Polyketide cyclase / dehydrase and lipid transport [Rhodococcus jostii]
MPYIRKSAHIDAAPEAAWDALRDWGALHTRLAVGFVTDSVIDRGDRVITFVDGSVVRERLVSCDEDARRLAWSIVDGPYEHHNASAQVSDDGHGGTVFVWIADILPASLADRTAQMMELGIDAVRRTLDGAGRCVDTR